MERLFEEFADLVARELARRWRAKCQREAQERMRLEPKQNPSDEAIQAMPKEEECLERN